MPSVGSVEHPRVRPGTLEDRLYQERIAQTAVDHNTLVVLPTGLGKTTVALRVMAEFLRREPTKSVLFLAPTRPLVVQHGRSAAEALFGPPPLVLTGTISPERRAALLSPPQIVVATPQVISNDLGHGDFSLGTFSLIVFDEAHRALGDYPYVAIARANREGAQARVLAMTASPGSRIERVRGVWANLGIERFEYRTLLDADVRPYTHAIGFETLEVPVPVEVRELGIRLRAALARSTNALHRLHLLPTPDASKRDLLALGERLHREVAVARQKGGSAPAAVWSGVTAQSVAMKTSHALDLIETQGVESLREFLGRQQPGPAGRMTPAQRSFLNDPDVQEVRRRLDSLDLEHPKVAATVELVRGELHSAPTARVLVFAQFRQTGEVLVEELRRLNDPAVRAARFVGQATKEDDVGLSQKEQIALLDRFRDGDVNCLVATSVAEEGLDIPSTDLVVFYEPVPDVVRTIQRRGRTGRARAGRAVVLVAQGTKDVGMDRSSRSKERRMHETLERVEEEARRGFIATAPSAKRVQTLIDEF